MIEILVSVGDHISIDDALITLESDKASMEVPSTHAGVVAEIKLKLEQQANQGDVILTLSVSETGTTQTDQTNSQESQVELKTITTEAPITTGADSQETLVKVAIPDIGGDSAQVIEILVSVGDQVSIDDALVTLESDKASMEVPSTTAGTIQSIDVQLDQEVTQGVIVVSVVSLPDSSKTAEPKESALSSKSPTEPRTKIAAQSAAQTTTTAKDAGTENDAVNPSPNVTNTSLGNSHASPSIRRFARELGVDLSLVPGSGRKNRISKMM